MIAPTHPSDSMHCGVPASHITASERGAAGPEQDFAQILGAMATKGPLQPRFAPVKRPIEEMAAHFDPQFPEQFRPAESDAGDISLLGQTSANFVAGTEVLANVQVGLGAGPGSSMPIEVVADLPAAAAISPAIDLGEVAPTSAVNIDQIVNVSKAAFPAHTLRFAALGLLHDRGLPVTAPSLSNSGETLPEIANAADAAPMVPRPVGFAPAADNSLGPNVLPHSAKVEAGSPVQSLQGQPHFQQVSASPALVRQFPSAEAEKLPGSPRQASGSRNQFGEVSLDRAEASRRASPSFLGGEDTHAKTVGVAPSTISLPNAEVQSNSRETISSDPVGNDPSPRTTRWGPSTAFEMAPRRTDTNSALPNVTDGRRPASTRSAISETTSTGRRFSIANPNAASMVAVAASMDQTEVVNVTIRIPQVDQGDAQMLAQVKQVLARYGMVAGKIIIGGRQAPSDEQRGDDQWR
ncbi:hypothetical protein [Novosphingobium fuchskuhlense]|nr:hypothetical protein [Novosphingobium fuchskuhlense]